MRLLFGIIIGALLTVGGAYMHDAQVAGSGTATDPAAARRTIVNWDVASEVASRTVQAARDQIGRLSGK
jgi:hypothetical protein